MRAARATSSPPCSTGLLLPVAEFEARLPGAVDHLLAERQRYSVAARRSVLGRTWPAICEELLGHYDAVHGPRGRVKPPSTASLSRASSTATGCHSSHVSSRLS